MTYSFSAQEKDRIFQLVAKLVGTIKIAEERAEIFLNNVERRMYLTHTKSLEEYLKYSSTHPQEHGYLISSLTIHTTHWFREIEHYNFVERHFSKSENQKSTFKALSVGCSTGEEVYSLALVLERIHHAYPAFDYQILGIDIDPVSVKKGQDAIYEAKYLEKIPKEHHEHILIGSGKTEGLMTLSKRIRERCSFKSMSALDIGQLTDAYDLAMCRNMLIYFTEEKVNEIVGLMSRLVSQNGIVMIGHSESYTSNLPLQRLAGSVFSVTSNSRSSSRSEPKRASSSLSGFEDHSKKEDQIDAIFYVPEQGDIQKIQRSIEDTAFCAQICNDFEKTKGLLQQSTARMLVCCISGKLDRSLLQWFQSLKRLYRDMLVVIAVDDQEAVPKIENDVDQIVSRHTLITKAQSSIRELAKMIDIKKAGGRFSQLPVAVVDDDELVAETFANILSSAGFQTKTFFEGPSLLEFARQNPVQAVVSDFRMPGMDGHELAEEVNKIRKGLPFIVVTGFSPMKQVPKLIYQTLSKPVSPDQLVKVVQECLLDRYCGKLLELDESRLRKLDLIAIGGSTGAPQVFHKILSQLSGQTPPVLVVQHIPPQFQESFGEELSRRSGLKLVIVKEEVVCEENCVYIASADYHLKVRKDGKKIVAYADQSSKYKGLRPCVDYLFSTVAKNLSDLNCLGVMLTGMGDDGSYSLGDMRKAGHYTIAQDLTSSTVFGMPKVAIDHDCVDYVGTADEIKRIMSQIRK